LRAMLTLPYSTTPVSLYLAAAYVPGNNIGSPVTLAGTYRGAQNMGAMTEHSDPCENPALAPVSPPPSPVKSIIIIIITIIIIIIIR